MASDNNKSKQEIAVMATVLKSGDRQQECPRWSIMGPSFSSDDQASYIIRMGQSSTSPTKMVDDVEL